MLDVIIVGGGPAATSAAVYATRYNLSTMAIAGIFGGQVLETQHIDNYPGFSMITGMDLSDKMKKHAEQLGAKLVTTMVTDIEKTDNGFNVCTEGMCYQAKSIIIATGVKRRKLGFKGEGEYAGRGVSYCATCDAAFFGDKEVIIVGGGDSAAEAAQLLSKFAKKVYIVYRKGKENLRMKPVSIDMIENSDNIEFMFNTEIEEVRGEMMMDKVKFKDGREMPIQGVFIEIGYDPETTLAKKLGVDLDEKGYIKTNEHMQTNIDGVMAAGDCTNNDMKQIIIAAAEGATAARSAYEFVNS